MESNSAFCKAFSVIRFACDHISSLNTPPGLGLGGSPGNGSRVAMIASVLMPRHSALISILSAMPARHVASVSGVTKSLGCEAGIRRLTMFRSGSATVTAFGARLKLRVPVGADVCPFLSTANTRQYHVFSGSKVNDGRSRLSLIPSTVMVDAVENAGSVESCSV